MRDAAWPSGVYLAEFANADRFREALVRLREKGYTRLETYTPFPVPGTDGPLGLPRSRLPVAIFVIGLLGAIAAYAIQWYANAQSYPLNIGGRPPHAIPAFIVSTFEGTVLAASLAAFFGLFVVLRLPRLWHPVFEVDGFERATVDRFWIAIDARDRRSDAAMTARELDALGALRVVHLEQA
ncbi:MAG TPA: DUF3341 domain-containing protein [Gemmatimonadaceae bacterium]|nr:DUF3341 domain-containing protein [Gemmatimonadaceae bacterium]